VRIEWLHPMHVPVCRQQRASRIGGKSAAWKSELMRYGRESCWDRDGNTTRLEEAIE